MLLPSASFSNFASVARVKMALDAFAVAYVYGGCRVYMCFSRVRVFAKSFELVF